MAPDTTTAASGDHSPSWRSETSSSDESSRFPTMVRTVVRHLESHLLDYGVGVRLEAGRTKAQTQGLNQEAAVLVSDFTPDKAATKIHKLHKTPSAAGGTGGYT